MMHPPKERSADVTHAAHPSPNRELPFGLSGREEARNYFAWMLGLFTGELEGAVLDHGAGTGALSALLAQTARCVVALEPEPSLAEALGWRFAATPNVTVHAATIDGYLAQRRAEASSTLTARPGLDAIISSNVLEHLPEDVACLRGLYAALRPGGALAVYVPARSELYGALDRSVGHLRRYARGELRSKLLEAGFEVEWVRYVNLVGVLPWFVQGRLLGRERVSEKSLRLFDRYVFPVARRLEQKLGLPYGLNVAALARRK